MDIESTIIKIQTQMNELKSEVGYNCATIPYVEYTVGKAEERIHSTINYDYIIEKVAERMLKVIEIRYRELRDDRLSLNMTDEEFEQELETLIFGRVINNE